MAQFNANPKDSASPQQKTVRALAAYGKCYDARTDRLAASLGKNGAGPLMGARANLREFQQALDAFTSNALAATDPPADAVKTAYAQLYEKQFRYAFYQGYEAAKPPGTTAKSAASSAASHSAAASTAGARSSNDSASGAAASSNPAGVSAPSTAPTPAAAAASEANAPGDANPITSAKNHFGELLDALPEDKEHQLHAAFGEIVGRSQISETMRLAIYRYVIFLLEPPSATPFSPPPF
jgi:hypothetical protein